MSSTHGLFFLLYIAILSHTAFGQDKFAFTAKMWNDGFPGIRIVHPGDVVVISCETNRPSAKVNLKVDLLKGPQDAAIYFKGRYQQVGQNFSVLVEGRDKYRNRCVAEDKGETISLVLGSFVVAPNPRRVEVGFIPDISPFMLEVGGDRNVTCEAAGTGDPKKSYLKWFKKDLNSNTLTPVSSSLVYYYGETRPTKAYDFVTLMFKKADQTMTGVYTCVREYQGTQTSKDLNVQLEVVVKPTATLTEGLPFETVREGDPKLSATCTVKGSPTPERNWYKDNKVIRRCPDKTVDVCYLDIRNPKFPRDNGTYVCRASSSAGKAEVSLSLLVQVPVSLVKPAKEFLFGHEQTANIFCQIERGNPLPVITWQFQAYICKQDGKKCQPDANAWDVLPSRVQVFPPGSAPTNVSRLSVPKSKYPDFYRCVAKNSFSQDFYEFAIRRIEVSPPTMSLSKVKPKYDEKEQVNITCGAEFNSFKPPYWLKDGKPLPKIVRRVSGIKEGMQIDQLIFMRLNVSDSGNYTCAAEQRLGGEQSMSRVLDVRALLKPTIRNFTNQIGYDEATVSILCDVVANPEPTLTWLFNGKKVQADLLVNKKGCATSTGGMFFLQSDKLRKELIVCVADFTKHSGKFTCQAKNRLGENEATKILTVYGAPKIIDWFSTYLYKLGTTVTLLCESSGFPSPNVTWHKVGKDGTLVPFPSRLINNSTAIMEIIDAPELSAGNYSCISYNKYGRTQKFVSLLFAGSVEQIQGKVSSSMVGGLVAALLLVILCALIFIFWYRRRLAKKYAPYLAPNSDFQLNPDKSLFEQSSELPYDLDWEFPRDRLTFLKVLGSGAFGQVWLADAQGILAFNARDKSSMASKRRAKLKRSLRYSSIGPYKKRKQSQAQAMIPDDFLDKTQVAVKTLKEDASESDYKDLASELKILIHLGEHKNIVNLLGACTQSGKLCVVIEYCPHGNLLNFLRARREIFEPVWYKNETDIENECTYADLTMAAYQIAKGMDFLASKKCVHRDVAARNVLVGVDYIMKIADFGLARDIYKDEFYLKSTSGLLPVKWMSPESLFDKIYTEQSDVWSYGILLWEIFTLGGSPYPGLPTEDLFAFLQDNRRMDQPELCPLEVYAIMRDCWERSPADRPLFSQIVDRLGSILNKHAGKDNAYIDFNEGTEEEPQDTDYLIPEKMKQGPDDYLRIKEEARLNGYDPTSPTPAPPLDAKYDDGEGFPMNPPPYVPQSYIPMQNMSPGYSNLPYDGRRTESSISSSEIIV